MKLHFALLVLFIAVRIQSTLTIQQYQILEKDNPENLLEELQFSFKGENYPNIEKLIFLTPWNKKGFEYTLKYVDKIDYVSPCWYTLKIGKDSQPIFQNEYNYDRTYAEGIKQANGGIKLIPRIYIQGNDVNFFQTIGSDFSKFQKTIELIDRVIREKNFDGIVWDTPFNFFEKERKQLNQFIVQLIKAIRSKIGNKIIMFNMANPMNHMNQLDLQEYNRLPINSILIQNYDSGDNYIEMVQKSLQWGNKLSKSIKIMLMLPFFSVKVKVGPLSTEQAVRSLKRMGVAATEIAKGMCKFTENKSKRIFLIPCYTYFKQVFSMAQSANASVGFWQGGNGLEKYYHFL